MGLAQSTGYDTCRDRVRYSSRPNAAKADRRAAVRLEPGDVQRVRELLCPIVNAVDAHA